MQSSQLETTRFEQTFLYRWLITLLPDELLLDPNSRSKAIVMSFILFCNMMSCLSFLIIILLGFNNTPSVVEYGVPLIFGCMLNYAIAGLTLLHFKHINLAGNLSLISPYISAVVGGWLTGGAFSPMLYILIIPPIFAFVLTNVTSGIAWFILTIFTFLVFWLVDQSGTYEPLFMITDSYEYALMQLILPITTCVMVMIAVAIYEANSIRLKRLLAMERNMLAFKAAHDPLTGLANREEFHSQLSLAISSARRLEYELSLLYIDLDAFKPINDERGHHAGDYVLVEIAKRLKQIVRGTDTVARLGGDEFAIILQGVADKARIEPILEKILVSIGHDVSLENGDKVNVYASVGVAFLPELEEDEWFAFDSEALCRQADAARYVAKSHKNTWCFYDDMNK